MTRTRAVQPGARLRWALASALALTLGAATLLPGADAGADDAPAPDTAHAPAATSTAVTWTGDLNGQAPCPEGMTRLRQVAANSLDGALPVPQFNNGWVAAPGLDNGGAARASVSSGDVADHLFLPYVQGRVNDRTMFALATRSTQGDSAYTRLQVNSVDLRVGTATSWRGRVHDITAATDDENGWLGAWFEHRSKGGAATTWDIDNLQIYTCRTAPVSRISGSDRYASAARIAATYPAGVGTAYLATGANFPDAISAAALAGRLDAPVLLTRPDSLPSATRTQLQRLQPSRLVVLGGTGAVSQAVQDDAAAYAGTTTRIGGTNRYDVSAGVARAYDPGVPVLYVASGEAFPDALAVGALAGHQNAPVLITPQDRLASVVAAEIDRLRPGRIVVVGGPGAVSEAVVDALRGRTAGGVTRIQGTDRYAVAGAIAQQFAPGRSRAYVATGTSFPDALVGAARAGSQGVPVLLSRSHGLPGAAGTALDRLEAGAGVLLGGDGALNALVMDQVGARVG
jgi:putative cell wall-binding protein